MVLRVDPPPSLEQLSRRLRVPVQPVLHFPTEAVGQGPLLGLSADTRPMGRAPTLHEGPEASPAVRTAGKPVSAVTPGNRSGGDTTPTAADAAGTATPTPGQDELRALLVYLNEVPPDSQTGEAQKLHLHLATRLDLPPEFPQSNLRAQYTALGRLLPTRPELGQLVGEFVRDRRAEPSGSQTPALDSQGAAKVAGASRANQAGGSGKSPGKGKGGSDYDTYFVAVMVRWRVNPRDTPEAIYPLSPGRLGMVLKKAFGDSVCPISRTKGSYATRRMGVGHSWACGPRLPPPWRGAEATPTSSSPTSGPRPTNNRIPVGCCGPTMWKRAMPCSSGCVVGTLWQDPKA